MFSNDPLFSQASPAAVAWVVGLYLALLAAGVIVALLLALRLARPDAPWAERARALAARPLTGRDGTLMVMVIVLLVLATLALAFPMQALGASPTSLMVVQSLLVDAGGLAGMAVILRNRRLSWSAVFGLRSASRREPDLAAFPDPTNPGFPAAIGHGAIGYLAMLPLIFFAGLVAQGVLSARGIPPTVQDVALLLSADHSPGVRVYLVLLAIGLAPFFEETVFRGVLLPLLARRFGLGAAVVVSSLLFSVIHLHLHSAAPLFVVGACFSLAYAYTGSLWVPVTMHSLFNGVNLALLLILRTP